LSVRAMRDLHRVIAIDTNGDDDDEWPVFDCLSVELRHGNTVFVLVAGEWYEVAATIADRARSYVDGLGVGAPVLIPYDPAIYAKESDYNIALAQSFGQGGAVLLDQKNIKAA